MNRRRAIAGCIAIATFIGLGTWLTTPALAIPVFDASNYAENVLQAARALTQINNQIQALQNQAAQIQQGAANLQRMDYNAVQQITNALQSVESLMGQAQGITFNVNETNDTFRRLYPDEYDAAVTNNQLVLDARSRWRTSMDGYRHTMTVQSQVVENVQSDRQLLADLVAQSQGSVGALQAQQATNQLLALSNKQQLQIQNMLAAQFRAEAIEQARNAASQEQSRAATKRFLGTRSFYPDN
ncbi:MAG: P-type conjugative transfer protein TrbJ [Rhodospirillaceae bacterium]|nr:P-type conjugative transfer protein TrbJ [Rhodospirillaceae bacterium]